MVLWQWINDNLPPYAEQITINEEVEQIQETLSQFKQLVPEGFKKLEPAKKNNWGSTEGLDKPLCERYLFVRENKRIWLDIPHELMEKLELPLGKTFPWPFYLKSEVLESEREEVEGAITIENEEEIFLKKSFTVGNLEEDITKLFDKIKELEGEKENQTKIITQKDTEITNLKTEKEETMKESAKLGGSWKSFADWLTINYKGREKELGLDLVKMPWIKGNYPYFTAIKNLMSGSPPFVLPYDENKNFRELWPGFFSGGVLNNHETWSKFEVPFNQWRNESLVYKNNQLQNRVNDLTNKIRELEDRLGIK